jgi:hypothetical protein
LVALNVNVIGEPGVACAGDAVLVMATSTLATTVADTVAALFAGFGSDVVDDPVTVFENGPVAASAGTVPVTTTVAVPPGANVPNEHATVAPGGWHDPRDGATLVIANWAGSASVSVAAVAFDGPLFVIVNVYANGRPATGLDDDADLVTTMSADGAATANWVDAMSLASFGSNVDVVTRSDNVTLEPVCAGDTVATSDTGNDAPAASVALAHVTTVPATVHPAGGTPENATLLRGPKSAVTVALVASDGPTFDAVKVTDT